MSGFTVKKVATKPFQGQKPGTSGLRKKVTVFQEEHYLANFVQASFNSLPQDGLKGSTLVLGGDGRYFNKEALQIIIKMAAANGVGGLLVGHNGILSTPAVSALIRGRKALGAFILTASHNPGGPTADFGIKYNMSNGGPAPENVTNAIYDQTTKLTEYLISDLPSVDLNAIGKHTYGSFTVEIIDSADDYLALMKTIFDFEALKNLIARPDFKMIFDSLSGVTGAYTERIFVKELGAAVSALQNFHPSEDFNGHHPDPNLTYAPELVEKMYSGAFDFGAASDGDGDRNMILGKKFFVNPSDSIAVIAANSSAIPYFKAGLKGLARSMPTSGALDRVARALGFECYEVPTGWKFFGNLMDAGKCSLCGEESFGTGSDHIREKDGVWAVLAWLSIIAARNTDPKQPLVTVEDIVSEHWARFGRNYFSRYDFEEVTTAQGDAVIKHLNDHLRDKLVGKTLKDPSSGKEFTVATADNFEYKDPIDKSVSSNQGLRIIFSDGSRLIYRLSGTGASGATIRVYFDMYDAKNVKHETQEALRPLINVGMELAQIDKLALRKTPTVIT